MKFSKNDITLIRESATKIGITTSVAMAVIAVESGGVTHTMIGGKARPLIRWEGHYFDRLVPAEKRDEARRAGLASPKAGRIKNPRSQAERYQMLLRAMKIDVNAAIMSCSWGVGQIMGSHWESLGFASPRHFYKYVCSSVAAQADVMFRYIEVNDLADDLRRRDWSAFARGYNGPAYAKYGYHIKLAKAYTKYGGKLGPASSVSRALRMGSKGKRVREVQQLLVRAGHVLTVDGDFGPSTSSVVRDFQRENDLTVDGVVGPKTMEKIISFRVNPSEDVGATPIVDMEGVRNGAVSAIGGVSAATAADKIGMVADQIGYTGLAWVDHAVTGLYVISGLLVLSGIAWGVYSYFENQETFEGVA